MAPQETRPPKQCWNRGFVTYRNCPVKTTPQWCKQQCSSMFHALWVEPWHEALCEAIEGKHAASNKPAWNPCHYSLLHTPSHKKKHNYISYQVSLLLAHFNSDRVRRDINICPIYQPLSDALIIISLLSPFKTTTLSASIPFSVTPIFVGTLSVAPNSSGVN